MEGEGRGKWRTWLEAPFRDFGRSLSLNKEAENPIHFELSWFRNEMLKRFESKWPLISNRLQFLGFSWEKWKGVTLENDGVYRLLPDLHMGKQLNHYAKIYILPVENETASERYRIITINPKESGKHRQNLRHLLESSWVGKVKPVAKAPALICISHCPICE